MILKWDKGYELFEAIGRMFTKFLNYTNYGSAFVFGKTTDHFFAFKVREASKLQDFTYMLSF